MERPWFCAGWASREFTPAAGTPLGGYGARPGPSTGSHDALSCLAIALGSRDRPLVLIVADMVAISGTDTEAVRTAVRAAVPDAVVWLTATHTHAGPDLTAWGPAVERAHARLLAAAVDAALAAVANMAPASLRHAHTTVAGVGARRNSGGAGTGREGEALPLDLLIATRTGADGDGAGDGPGEVAVLGVLPCHATVLGAENLLATADLFGAFRDALCATVGPRLGWAALMQGAAGDVSSRRTRRAQTFDEAARLGGFVAAAAARAMATAEPVPVHVVRTGHEILPLATKPAMDPAVREGRRQAAALARDTALGAGDAVAARMAETALQGAEAEARRDRSLGRLTIAGEIAVAALGNLALAAVPGELYLGLGERLVQGAGEGTIVVGYANGYVGYLPPAEAYAGDDYEPRIASVAAGQAEAIVARLVALVRAVRPTVSQVEAGDDVVDALSAKIGASVDAALAGQRRALTRAAALVAQTIAQGGIVHTFGTGHSHMLAEEIYSRAGGLANVNAIEPSVLQLYEHAIASGAWERLSGAARIALDYAVIEARRDCLIVISNSGRNAAPVEAALWAREHGMPVIAITSLAHSRAVVSTAPSGERLFEVADVVLDNGGVAGDAAIGIASQGEVAPMSTIGGAAVVHALVALAVARCRAEGRMAPVIRSGNIPGAREANARMLSAYPGALPAIYDRYRVRVRDAAVDRP